MVHRNRPRTNLTLDPDIKDRGKHLARQWRYRSLSQLIDQLLSFAWDVTFSELGAEEQAELFRREVARFHIPRR